MAAAPFTFADALILDEGFGHRLKVIVDFDNGKPTGVAFSDPDRSEMVTVPFDLWERVIAAVARTVDANEVSGS